MKVKCYRKSTSMTLSSSRRMFLSVGRNFIIFFLRIYSHYNKSHFIIGMFIGTCWSIVSCPWICHNSVIFVGCENCPIREVFCFGKNSFIIFFFKYFFYYNNETHRISWICYRRIWVSYWTWLSTKWANWLFMRFTPCERFKPHGAMLHPCGWTFRTNEDSFYTYDDFGKCFTFLNKHDPLFFFL